MNTEFEKTVLKLMEESEAAVFFKRDKKTGQLLMTPVFKDADKMNIPKMVTLTLEYSNGLKYFSEDVINKTMKKQGRQN